MLITHLGRFPLGRLYSKAIVLAGLYLHVGAVSAEVTQLDEIIVTATKRESSVRDVPTSIEAFRGDDLVDQGATALTEILRNVPSANASGHQVSIRGVGLSPDISLGAAEETGRFLGDISLNAPSTRGGLAEFDPYDMSTVEILKGPQSTLFGGTALAGAIRYVPNKPDFEEFSGSVRIGYGHVEHSDDAQQEISAMLNVPVSDTFAFRVAGTHRERPGIIDDTTRGIEDTNFQDLDQVRIMARWQATDRLTFDVTYLDYTFDSEFSLIDDPSNFVTSVKSIDEPQEILLDVASLNVEYAFDAFTVTGIFSKLESSEDWTLDAAPILALGVGPTPLFIDTQIDIPSYELRLVSNSPSESSWSLLDNWDYIAGLYFMDGEQKVSQVIQLPAFNNLEINRNDNSADVSETAFFANLTRKFLDDRLELNIGARYAETKLNTDYSTSGLDLTTFQPIPPIQFVEEVKDTRTNPTFALTWHINDDMNIRGSFSEGFRFGGANSAPTIGVEPIPPTFDSDSLKNHEIGFRSEWLEQTLLFDVTAYLIKWEDLQLTQISPLGLNFVDNLSKAKINGVESQLAWQMSSGFKLNVGFSVIDAETDEFFVSANGPVAKGTQLPLSPEESAAIGLEWAGSWDEWEIDASVRAHYAGDRKNNLVETYRFPSQTTYDASLRVANPNWLGSPAFVLSGTNLTDEFPVVNAIPVAGNPNVHVFSVQRPRTVTLNVEFSF